jgi:hypothetical protein
MRRKRRAELHGPAGDLGCAQQGAADCSSGKSAGPAFRIQHVGDGE